MIKIKPSELAYLQKGQDRHICEIMSFATPTNTVIVRRVPGHAGTLEEVHIDALSEVERPKRFKWMHYAIVQGRSQFPVDMLRYDGCVPVNFSLQEHKYGTKAQIDEVFGMKELLVAAISERKAEPWTYDRWSSFMWVARHIKTESFPGE